MHCTLIKLELSKTLVWLIKSTFVCGIVRNADQSGRAV
jgi:hypothetical protein